MTIREICEKYDLSQTELAKRFGIPLRTVQNWCTGQRMPPEYLPNMIEQLLEIDKEKA